MAKDPRFYLKVMKGTIQVMKHMTKTVNRAVNFMKYQVKTATTIKDVWRVVPSTTVVEFGNLYEGAHVRFGNPKGYSHHAIVTNIDKDQRKFKVIEIDCDNAFKQYRKAKLIEETRTYQKYGDVLLVNYQEKFCLIPKFVRVPHQASVAVAQYFKNNPDALQSYTSNGMMDNCENFAVSCTLGYSFGFQQLKRLIIALGALKMIDNKVVDELIEYMSKKRIFTHDQGDSFLTVKLQSGETVKIDF